MSSRPSVRLELGSVLQERYKVVRFIGRGGMGSVYLCEDLRLPGTLWAVKEMNVYASNLEQVKESFEREARFLASLRHRGMPMIVDVFSVDSYQYLVMEYIDGQTLAQKVENEGVPKPSIALSWTLELAQVLDYLHRQKKPVIFRDLKPENIMMTGDGRLKVIDFGLARHFEPEKGCDTEASGTVGYTAPEQWEDSEQSDPRVDIYSLGATLFFLLTGKSPGPVYGNINLRKLCPDVEPEVENLVLKCMQIAPEARYHSSGELITNLLGILSKEQHQKVLRERLPVPVPIVEPEPAVSPKRERPRVKPLTIPIKSGNKLPHLLIAGLIFFLFGAAAPFLGFCNWDTFFSPVTINVENQELKGEISEDIHSGRYAEAISKLDALITRYPEDAEAHILKNNAYALMTGGEVYRIPAISSWQGQEWEGLDALFGWALAQTQLNSARTGDKPVIYLELYNDQSEPERLLEIIKSLAEDKAVPLVLGPWSSQQALLVAPLVNDGGLPVLTPVASDPRVLPSGPSVFCVADTDINKTRALAEELYGAGKRKAAVFADRGRYVSRTIAGLFSESFEELGGEIVFQNDYPNQQADFSDRVKRARERGADCVFLAEYRVDPVLNFIQF